MSLFESLFESVCEMFESFFELVYVVQMTIRQVYYQWPILFEACNRVWPTVDAMRQCFELSTGGNQL